MTDSPEIKVLITQVTKLADSVDKLVIIDAARIEREKQQAMENEKFNAFIQNNAEPLTRLKRSHSRYDKWGDKIGFLIILSILAATGFNFYQ